jgi:hypothetical protein
VPGPSSSPNILTQTSVVKTWRSNTEEGATKVSRARALPKGAINSCPNISFELPRPLRPRRLSLGLRPSLLGVLLRALAAPAKMQTPHHS